MNTYRVMQMTSKNKEIYTLDSRNPVTEYGSTCQSIDCYCVSFSVRLLMVRKYQRRLSDNMPSIAERPECARKIQKYAISAFLIGKGPHISL
jgi:hypothetical protein